MTRSVRKNELTVGLFVVVPLSTLWQGVNTNVTGKEGQHVLRRKGLLPKYTLKGAVRRMNHVSALAKTKVADHPIQLTTQLCIVGESCGQNQVGVGQK